MRLQASEFLTFCSFDKPGSWISCTGVLLTSLQHAENTWAFLNGARLVGCCCSTWDIDRGSDGCGVVFWCMRLWNGFPLAFHGALGQWNYLNRAEAIRTPRFGVIKDLYWSAGSCARSVRGYLGPAHAQCTRLHQRLPTATQYSSALRGGVWWEMPLLWCL